MSPVNPATVAAGAQVMQGFMGSKSARAAGRSAAQVAELNAQAAEAEAITLARAKADEESSLRRQSEYLKGSARVAAAKSGIQQNLRQLRSVYIGTEMDAARIQYASDIEQINKRAEAQQYRAGGAATKSAYDSKATASLLGGAAQGATTYKTFNP